MPFDRSHDHSPIVLGNDMSIEIRVNAKNGMLFVDMNGSFADSEGLLGADPKEGKPLLARDGTTDLTNHWNTYGEEWQVNNVDPKLFQDTKRHPQYPESCVYKAEKKNSYVRLAAWPPGCLAALPDNKPSLDQLDLTRAPGLLEPRLQRRVEAEHRVPPLAGIRLYPVVLLSFTYLTFSMSPNFQVWSRALFSGP